MDTEGMSRKTLKRAIRPTGAERTLIDAIRWLAVKGGWVGLPEIAERTGQTTQGVAEVGISARRKDLVRRVTGDGGRVYYSLTDKGWGLARARSAQRPAGTEQVPLRCGHHRQLAQDKAQHVRVHGSAYCPICQRPTAVKT